MNPIERKLMRNCAALGTALTLLVMLMHLMGLLTPLEQYLYDLRAQWCQVFQPPPTDRLVHIDIDDHALDTIGRWPWPRAKMARIVEELDRAGAKVVALDILYTEPQEPRPRFDTQGRFTGQWIHDDELYARSLKEAQAVVASGFTADDPLAELNGLGRRQLWRALMAQPTLARPQAAELLQRRAPELSEPQLQELLEEHFVDTRRLVIMHRIQRVLQRRPNVTEPQLRKAVLGAQEQHQIVETPASRVFQRELAKARSVRQLLRRLPRADPADRLNERRVDLVPIPEVSRAVPAVGFYDAYRDSDGVIRYKPLWIRCEGRRVPQMGLLMACRWLGVDLADVRIEPKRIILPLPDGSEIRIPVRRLRPADGGQPLYAVMDLPWFGGPRWERMYDPPGSAADQSGHMPIGQVWVVAETRQRIRRNNERADAALVKLWRNLLFPEPLPFDPDDPPPVEDFEARREPIRRIMEVFERDLLPVYEQMSPEQLAQKQENNPRSVAPLRFYQTLKSVQRINPELREQLRRQQARLRQRIAGQATLVGWTATMVAADFWPTSLHDRCPGMVIHGVVFNSIVSRSFWHRLPGWADLLAIAAVGLLATWATAALSPARALLSVAALAGAWVLLNAVILFDLLDQLLIVGAPLASLVLIWPAGTLLKVVVERRERDRIEGRFRTYVDRALVDYVIEHPDKARLDGEVRVMSVVFTDLANFTTISERMGNETVSILNEYLRRMVPLIEAHNGFVNKFLGDGIMFFYNAPYENAQHAQDAVRTVMAMHDELVAFNGWLAGRGLPPVGMRAGVTTGTMIVGDAGGEGRSDYTVLGDTVNTAARLESANKAVQTNTMIDQRTADRLGGVYLLRLIGKLQVVGKSEGLVVYEPLSLAERATDRHREYADRTRLMVEAFWAGDFQATLQAVETLRERFGDSKLIKLYEDLARQHAQSPPGPDFDGTIELTSK